MDSLTIIQHDSFSTTITSPNDNTILYSIRSRHHPEGYWSSIITRTTLHKSDIELATVSYFDWSDTRVKFPQRDVDLNEFLPRQNSFRTSRIFVAPDGQTYKWKIKGDTLQLHNLTSHTLLARSHASRPSLNLLSKKHHPALLSVSRRFSLADDPQMLDAIVLTYTIMQHKLQERAAFRYP